MNNCLYEVYACYHNDEIVYIGSGKFGRNQHCLSGTSHNYNLNKLYFTDNENTRVEVLRFVKTKEESLSIEKELIKFHKPIFNDVYVSNTRYEKSRVGVNIRNEFLTKFETFNLTGWNKDKLDKLFDEFFNHYNINDVVNNKIVIFPYSLYKENDLYYLAQLSKFLRNVAAKEYTEKHYCRMFYLAFTEIMGYSMIDCLVNTDTSKSKLWY